MKIAKEGDLVKVHYSGRLTTGESFDSSEGRDPLEFTVAAGQMIKGFDAALPGMQVGEKKTIHIPFADAYGAWSEEAVIAFPKENVPADMALQVGMQLTLQNAQGYPVPVVIMEIREDVIMLDANHMLAGKDLVFDIELVSIA